jgi:hypothetical protein
VGISDPISQSHSVQFTAFHTIENVPHYSCVACTALVRRTRCIEYIHITKFLRSSIRPCPEIPSLSYHEGFIKTIFKQKSLRAIGTVSSQSTVRMHSCLLIGSDGRWRLLTKTRHVYLSLLASSNNTAGLLVCKT